MLAKQAPAPDLVVLREQIAAAHKTAHKALAAGLHPELSRIELKLRICLDILDGLKATAPAPAAADAEPHQPAGQDGAIKR